jgi:hypothetical protein
MPVIRFRWNPTPSNYRGIRDVIGPAFALALALLWAAPALAQTTFDPIEVQRERMLRAKPHLPDNASLTAAATTLYPTGLWRDDHTAGRGAPPLFFQPQAGTCTANSMANDGGACTDGAGGNSWRAIHPADGLDIRQFGAPTDGVSSSGAAIQAAINEALRIGAQNLGSRGAPPVVFPGPGEGATGDWVVESTITCFPTSDLKLVWKQGARVLVNWTGAGNFAFDCTSPGALGTRGKLLYFVDSRIELDARVTAEQVGASFLKYRYASGLIFQGFTSWYHNRNNTLFSVSSCWNCDFGPASFWNGGKNWLRKSTDGITFSITADTNTLISSGAVFDADDVGKVILLTFQAGSTSQLFTISGFTNSTTVTTSQNAIVTYTNKPGVFDNVTGSIESGANTLTLDAPVATAADVGRIIYVVGAGTPRRAYGNTAMLRTTITAVTDASNVVLADNAGATVTSQYAIVSPAVELYSDTLNEQNDIRWPSLHVSNFAGTGLVVKGGLDIRITSPKINAKNGFHDASSSTFNAIFDEVLTATVTAPVFEGAAVNSLGAIYVGGLINQIQLSDTQVYIPAHQRMIYKDTGTNGSIVTVNNVSLNAVNLDIATVDNLFVSVGSGSIQPSGSISSVAENYIRIPFSNLKGTSTNTSALPGYVGELITARAGGADTTVTVTIATPGVVTWTEHGFSTSTPTPVNFTTTGALPTGLAADTNYWTVPSTVTTDTFQLAASIDDAIAGTAIATSGSQSGVHTGVNSAILTSEAVLSILGIPLTPGDWECYGGVRFIPAASTTQTVNGAGITPILDNVSSVDNGGGTVRASFPVAEGEPLTMQTGISRRLLNSATTVYLATHATFAVSTETVAGRQECRRVR